MLENYDKLTLLKSCRYTIILRSGQVIGGKRGECKKKEKLCHHSMMKDIVELGAATRLKEVKIDWIIFNGLLK